MQSFAPEKDKFDAIIMDPDIGSRMRLKQASASVHNFGRVLQLSNPREGLDKLNSKDKTDIVFISYKIEQVEIAAFIKQGKETPGGQDSAYVLVLPPSEQSSQTVTTNVLVGADGFLFEPYSVDYLVEITRLAAKVKMERGDAREKAAINFLIQDVMSQIDAIAYEKAFGKDVAPKLRKFRDTLAVLNTFSGPSLQNYYDLCTDALINAPIPKKIFTKYVGVSSRVKKKMDAAKEVKAAADAEAAAKAPETSSTPN